MQTNKITSMQDYLDIAIDLEIQRINLPFWRFKKRRELKRQIESAEELARIHYLASK
jgi:hypothetical protein